MGVEGFLFPPLPEKIILILVREGDDWSLFEVEAAVASYGEMLRLELAGILFNKAERNRSLQKLITRGRGSIEFKHQNISAILNRAGFPYISGYKPLNKFQGLLEDVVIERLIENVTINTLAGNIAFRQEFSEPISASVLAIKVAPPPGIDEHVDYGNVAEAKRLLITGKKNYAEIEARNAALGLAGENLVMAYEHERLWTAGCRRLAEKIEHVSTTKGDHLGYDILSFEENGKERLIEVKTTQFGPMTPFFASRNEVEVSIERSDSYQLYRLYSFSKNAKLFSLEGAIGNRCSLTPVVFSAVPRQ